MDQLTAKMTWRLINNEIKMLVAALRGTHWVQDSHMIRYSRSVCFLSLLQEKENRDKIT